MSWIQEIEDDIEEQAQLDQDCWDLAWDDVKGGALRMEDVKAARHEEITYMQGRRIWSLKPIAECWDKTGKPPTSVRWVDTDKGIPPEVMVRSRLVARDFKGQEFVCRDSSFRSQKDLTQQSSHQEAGWQM